jgi:crotonobetainyl-CoA:carnitine CoA-transferase CaiB-like acyl-CoA transferase
MPFESPFAHLKVIELASVLAGPAVGLWFVEMGARVIKVENPLSGGDVTRHWKTPNEPNRGNISAYFASVNANKEHLFLDLNNEQDYHTLIELIKSADILLTNFKHGDDLKFKLDYSSLKSINQSLIYAAISGFSSQPERTAFDVIIQAETGFMSMNGNQNSGPIKLPVALMDILAAQQLTQGILSALYLREKNGKGCLVSVSLENAALSALANQATNFLMNGKEAVRMGSLHPNIAPYGDIYTTMEGVELIMAIGSDKQFSRMCSLLGHPDIALDPKLNTNANRVMNRPFLNSRLQQIFSTIKYAEIYPLLISNNIPVGRIRTISEVLSDPIYESRILDSEESGYRTRRMRMKAFDIVSKDEV